jgi:hypothetical protein
MAGVAFGDTVCLKDGSIIKGKILAVNAQTMEFESAAGVMSIAREKVESFTVLGEDQNQSGKPVESVACSKPLSQGEVAPAENNFEMYHGPSFYSTRTLGLGFSAGNGANISANDNVDAGLSILYNFYYGAVVFSGMPFPNREGHFFAAQVQFDLVRFRYQRFFTYGGATYALDQGTVRQPFSIGFGYGWVAFKNLGFSISGGVQKDTAGTTRSNGTSYSWQPDINGMIHFYIF